MLGTLQIITICLTTVALSTSLAHALELPGKRRLDRTAYATTQTIYYPGFTIGGFGEVFAIIANVILLVILPSSDGAFWWTVLALMALLAMHGVYWTMTHPVNRFWLKDKKLATLSTRFFSVGAPEANDGSADDPDTLWRQYRDRWETSHVIRTVFAALAFIALLIALER